MNNTFKEMLNAYTATTSEVIKSVLYDAMVSYTKSYHEGYVCYDMDMYTTLYKYASTSKQRKDALNQIYSIIVDPALYDSELFENFKEFFSLNSILHDDDICEFDIICIEFLTKFSKRFEEIKAQDGSGMADFYDAFPYNDAKAYLKKVMEDILGTGRQLETCSLIEEISKKLWFKRAVKIFTVFFFI